MHHALLQQKTVPWGTLHGGGILWKMIEFGLTDSAQGYTQLTPFLLMVIVSSLKSAPQMPEKFKR